MKMMPKTYRLDDWNGLTGSFQSGTELIEWSLPVETEKRYGPDRGERWIIQSIVFMAEYHDNLCKEFVKIVDEVNKKIWTIYFYDYTTIEGNRRQKILEIPFIVNSLHAIHLMYSDYPLILVGKIERVI